MALFEEARPSPNLIDVSMEIPVSSDSFTIFLARSLPISAISELTMKRSMNESDVAR